MAATDWTTVGQLPEEALGRRILRRERIVGYAHTWERFAEVYDFAWRNATNDAVVIALASRQDDGAILLAQYEETFPGNEACLVHTYPTVIGRYLDGQWISVVSTKVDRDSVVRALHQALSRFPEIFVLDDRDL